MTAIEHPIPSPEQRAQSTSWRRIAVSSIALLVASLVVNAGQALSNRNQGQDARRISDCRSELTTDFFRALKDTQVAIGVAAGVVPKDQADATIGEAIVAADRAIDARDTYDADPGAPCPDPRTTSKEKHP